MRPLHEAVPKELRANLEFRNRLVAAGYKSKEKAAAIREMCRVDPVFFVNTFCWTLNPVWHPDQPEQPFITYPYQDLAIRELSASVGKHDIATVKSRETGASWMGLFVIFHRWNFFRKQKFVLVSRNQELVDPAGDVGTKDMDALMPKLDFILEYLPRWLKPKMGGRDRSELRMHNPITDSLVTGTSTTGDICRGGRPTGIMMDEFAFFDHKAGYQVLKSTQGATKCRWFVSTPNGVGNAFYDVIHDTEIKQLIYKWEDMPHKRHGLYRGTDRELEIIDKTFSFPADYKFKRDGKLRSVWYDAEEKRTPIASLMAQEHDRDFLGSGRPFFNVKELQRLEEFARSPKRRGDFEDGKFAEREGGKWKLWCNLKADGEAPDDRRYAVGADVSAGTGASNSCIAVIDGRTGEKVAEYADPHIQPHDLADEAAVAGRFFKDWAGDPAVVIWEANGPGRTFGAQLKKVAYPRVFYHTSIQDDEEKKRSVPGFWVTPASKQALLRGYAIAISRGDVIERSSETLRECREYHYLENGQIGHIKSVSSEDSSGAKANHGDRVAASALATHAMKGQQENTPALDIDREPDYPCLYNTLKKMKAEKMAERRQLEGWLVG